MNRLKFSDTWTKKKSSSWIFGNFIESGFGRQVDGMWSEMLYNRAFREVPPYNPATWEWLGIDREHYGKLAPFWHSGYEENDWEIVGNPKVSRSCGNYTYKGTTSYLLENKNEGESCGLRQHGIHLQHGREYIFQITAGVRGDIGSAGLNGFGDTIHSGKSYPLFIKLGSAETNFLLTTEVKKYEWNIKPDSWEDAALSIKFDFEGTLILACVSMMPSDHVNGWRREVVEQLSTVSPSVVRFPGGCFVSFYNWEKSIGNRDTREPQPSFYWGGLEENDVGLDEFMDLSEQVGFEPQICFNMMTSIPFKARQLVEYLNAPEDVGMGRLRKLNGHPVPYKVKLFEMDNEPGRKWTAVQYAQQCVEFAKEMRQADSSVQFMMAAYSYAPELLSQMLEIAGREINYVIYRQGNPQFVKSILMVLEEYNTKNDTDIRLANTEWLPSCKSCEPFDDPDVPVDFSWHGEITNNYKTIFSIHQMSWNYALNGAHRLLDYISYGGDFALANFNNMCNTWGQNVLEATKDTCYLSCMGKVFAFFNRTFFSCIAADVETGDELLFALVINSLDGRERLYLVNHSSSEKTVMLPQKKSVSEKWNCIDGLVGRRRLSGEKENTSVVESYSVGSIDRTFLMLPLSLICLEKEGEIHE